MSKTRDSKLESLGRSLDRAKANYRAAKERTTSCRMALDRARPDVDYCKAEIASVKSTIASERQMANYCYSAGDHLGAKAHSINAQNMKPRLDALYDSKNRAYALFNSCRESFNAAKAEQQRVKAELDSAYAAFNQRLAEVKAENARERANWREKRCRSCGATIRYHVGWSRVPDLCKPCREREKAKQRERPCKKCGQPVRYNIEWSHPPNYCKACKAGFR